MKVVFRGEDEKIKGIPRKSHLSSDSDHNEDDDGTIFAKITLLKKAKK